MYLLDETSGWVCLVDAAEGVPEDAVLERALEISVTVRSLERVPVASVRRAAQFELEFIRITDRDCIFADARHHIAVAVDFRSNAVDLRGNDVADELRGNLRFAQAARSRWDHEPRSPRI